jgi:hypothetical protein
MLADRRFRQSPIGTDARSVAYYVRVLADRRSHLISYR